MKKKKFFSKTISSEDMKNFNAVFDKYFDKYYSAHREVKNVSYYKMSDCSGYSAILEYKNFRQYVNIYYDAYNHNTVNCCFEFESDGKKFLCHFVDVLDLRDSDDISFYTYDYCLTDEQITDALNNVMSATQKYQSILNSIALSDELSQELYMHIYEDAEGDECIDLPDDVLDMSYFIYGLCYEMDELKKYLNRRKKRNKLSDGYETRAQRVLSKTDKEQIRKVKKNKKKLYGYSTKDKILLYAPYAVMAVVFAVLFGVLGVNIDKHVFDNCFGRSYFDTAVGFATVGVFLSVIFTWFIQKPLYKLILKKDYYDKFQQIIKAESSPSGVIFVVGVLIILVCFFFTMFFCFNGMAFNDDGDIVYKETAFSEQNVISFEDAEIAILQGTHSGRSHSYSEYDETAYAFQLDGEWYEYGVPNDERAEKLILNSIEKYDKNVKTYKSIEDIEQ